MFDKISLFTDFETVIFGRTIEFSTVTLFSIVTLSQIIEFTTFTLLPTVQLFPKTLFPSIIALLLFSKLLPQTYLPFCVFIGFTLAQVTLPSIISEFDCLYWLIEPISDQYPL